MRGTNQPCPNQNKTRGSDPHTKLISKEKTIMHEMQKEEYKGRARGSMFAEGGLAVKTYKNREKTRWSNRANPVLIVATAAAIMFTSAAPLAAAQEQGGLLRAGNGPGPAANAAGPGCNIVPPFASIGKKVNIKQFPPADSLTDPELAGPVELLKSGKFDLPIEKFTKLNVPPG